MNLTGSFNNLIGIATAGTNLTGQNGFQGNQIGIVAAPINPFFILSNSANPTVLGLQPNSPAINTGDNSFTIAAGLTTDINGLNRIVDSVVDIGADEFQQPTAITVTSSANPSGVGQSITFTATLALVPGSNPLTGPVTFLIDAGTSINATLNGLTASITLSTLAAGSHTIVASYATAPYPKSTSNTLTQLVNGPPIPPPPLRYIAVGADAGGGPEVVVYNASPGAELSAFYVFAPTFTNGVRVAVADVNGDGVPDIIAAAGPGGGPQVIVIDGSELAQVQSNGVIAPSAVLASFFAFAPTFTGGVYVAAAVSVGDKPEIVVGAGGGGGPQVTVIDGTKLAQLQSNGTLAPSAMLASFYAFAPTFTGGVRVAVGDLNQDGTLDVIAAAGPGGGPQVAVIDGTRLDQRFFNGQIATSAVLASFYAFSASFTGGVFVSAGPTVGGTQVNLIFGADAGGGPQVEVVSAQLPILAVNGQVTTNTLLGSFFALPTSFTGGVRVGFSAAFSSNGQPAILTAAGPGGGPEVGVFDGSTFSGAQ